MSAKDIDNRDVEKVAEVAVEPAWISEIARKLQRYDEDWRGLSFPFAVRKAALAAHKLVEDNSNVEAVSVPVEGERVGSPHLSLGGESAMGVSEVREWNSYTIIHNTGMLSRMVRAGLRGAIDPNVSVEDKVNIAKTVSGRGDEQARNAELILHDHIDTLVRDPEDIRRSEYTDPGPDLYVESFNPTEVTGVSRVPMGLIIEVSVRWVNPLGSPYINSKRDQRSDMESGSDFPVDLLIMAPDIRANALERYAESSMVDLQTLPLEPSGNPIIVPDDADVQGMAEGTDIVGENYPVVETEYDEMTQMLDMVEREFHTIEELEYRRQISTLINSFIRERA